MYKLKYKRKAKFQIINFIEFYKNNFIKTFTDTGLFYEDIIRKNYIENSKQFKEDIKNSLEKILVENKIYGYFIIKNNIFEITIKVGTYRLFIEYSENNNSKIRIVENIKFNIKNQNI